MAKVAHNYHENLQNEGTNINLSQDEHKNKTCTFLKHIPKEQTIPKEHAMSLPLPVPPWVQWSNELVREMYIKRALQRLELQYPANSSDS